jgi:hypothetical protein
MFWYNWSHPSNTPNQTDYNAPMLSTTQHDFKIHLIKASTISAPLITLIDSFLFSSSGSHPLLSKGDCCIWLASSSASQHNVPLMLTRGQWTRWGIGAAGYGGRPRRRAAVRRVSRSLRPLSPRATSGLPICHHPRPPRHSRLWLCWRFPNFCFRKPSHAATEEWRGLIPSRKICSSRQSPSTGSSLL